MMMLASCRRVVFLAAVFVGGGVSSLSLRRVAAGGGAQPFIPPEGTSNQGGTDDPGVLERGDVLEGGDVVVATPQDANVRRSCLNRMLSRVLSSSRAEVYMHLLEGSYVTAIGAAISLVLWFLVIGMMQLGAGDVWLQGGTELLSFVFALFDVLFVLGGMHGKFFPAAELSTTEAGRADAPGDEARFCCIFGMLCAASFVFAAEFGIPTYLMFSNDASAGAGVKKGDVFGKCMGSLSVFVLFQLALMGSFVVVPTDMRGRWPTYVGARLNGQNAEDAVARVEARRASVAQAGPQVVRPRSTNPPLDSNGPQVFYL